MATNRGHRLTLENITQRFNDFVAVRDINLDVAGGALTARHYRYSARRLGT